MRRLLFVGLGNPDPEHEINRHNIGFLAVDELARRHRHSRWTRDFQSQLTELNFADERILLLKPQTYMNESGRAVQEAMSFFKLPLSCLTVFHDEIELPPAKLRVKVGGSDAGHNGLRSISEYVGNEYRRVRLGVGHPRQLFGARHPDLRDFVHRYVLSNFTKRDLVWVHALLKVVAENIDLLALGRDSSFQNKVHLSMQAKGFFKVDEGEE